MASNLDYAEDIEEAKAYMAKKNVFQLFEVRETMSLCFRTIRCTDQLPNTGQTLRSKAIFHLRFQFLFYRST